jgi:PhnB protein
MDHSKKWGSCCLFLQRCIRGREVYRLDEPRADVVVRLSVNGAEFWLSDGAEDTGNETPESVGGNTVRMILTVGNPDALFEQALKAGAKEIFPVGEGHGWSLGRFADPFGMHCEIGYQL